MSHHVLPVCLVLLLQLYSVMYMQDSRMSHPCIPRLAMPYDPRFRKCSSYYVELARKRILEASTPVARRKRTKDLPYAVRKLHAQQSLAARRMRQVDYEREWARQEQVAQDISIKHDTTVHAVRQKLSRSSTLKRPRAVTNWNAWQHCRYLEINDGRL